MRLLVIFIGFIIHVLNATALRAQSGSLQQAVAYARTQHPALRPVALDIQVAATDSIAARLRANPKLNNQSLFLMDAGAFYHQTGFGAARNNQIWWQLTKEFEWPTQRRARIQLAQQGVASAQMRYQRREQDAAAEAAYAWLEVELLTKRIGLLQEAKKNADSLVAINEIRLRNQAITATELMRVQILAEQYQLEVEQLQSAQRSAQTQLAYLTGGALREVSGDFQAAFALPMQPDSLLTLAYQRRGDWLESAQNQRLAQSELAVEQTRWLPKPELGMIYNPQNTLPYFGLFATVEIPIFDRNQGGIARARANTLRTMAEQTALQQQIRVETEAALIELQTQQRTLRRYAALIEQSDRILQTVRYAYTRGGTTLLDLLDAQRGWLDTRQLYEEQLARYHQAYIRLAVVAGVLFDL